MYPPVGVSCPPPPPLPNVIRAKIMFLARVTFDRHHFEGDHGYHTNDRADSAQRSYHKGDE